MLRSLNLILHILEIYYSCILFLSLQFLLMLFVETQLIFLLGEIIFTGLGLYRMDLLVLGGGLVAVLSLISGWAFDILTRRILRYKYV